MIKDFCNLIGLNPDEISGKNPTYDNQYDEYCVIGNGKINGLQVEKYGEFGNNIIQLIHSVRLAQKWGLGWLRLSNFGPMFIPGVYNSTSNVKVIINSPWEPIGESAIKLVSRLTDKQ